MKLFVDDLALSAIGQPQQVVHAMVKVLDFVIRHLEEVLRMVSASKSKVIAGRPQLAAEVAPRVASRRSRPPPTRSGWAQTPLEAGGGRCKGSLSSQGPSPGTKA